MTQEGAPEAAPTTVRFDDCDRRLLAPNATAGGSSSRTSSDFPAFGGDTARDREEWLDCFSETPRPMPLAEVWAEIEESEWPDWVRSALHGTPKGNSNATPTIPSPCEVPEPTSSGATGANTSSAAVTPLGTVVPPTNPKIPQLHLSRVARMKGNVSPGLRWAGSAQTEGMATMTNSSRAGTWSGSTTPLSTLTSGLSPVVQPAAVPSEAPVSPLAADSSTSTATSTSGDPSSQAEGTRATSEADASRTSNRCLEDSIRISVRWAYSASEDASSMVVMTDQLLPQAGRAAEQTPHAEGEAVGNSGGVDVNCSPSAAPTPAPLAVRGSGSAPTPQPLYPINDDKDPLQKTQVNSNTSPRFSNVNVSVPVSPAQLQPEADTDGTNPTTHTNPHQELTPSLRAFVYDQLSPRSIEALFLIPEPQRVATIRNLYRATHPTVHFVPSGF